MLYSDRKELVEGRGGALGHLARVSLGTNGVTAAAVKEEGGANNNLILVR